MPNPFPRGSRVLVRFEKSGPEGKPLEWTGTVLGKSKIPGRIKIKSDYVTWKGPWNYLPEGDVVSGYTIKRIPKDSPIYYNDSRGLVINRPYKSY